MAPNGPKAGRGGCKDDGGVKESVRAATDSDRPGPVRQLRPSIALKVAVQLRNETFMASLHIRLVAGKYTKTEWAVVWRLRRNCVGTRPWLPGDPKKSLGQYERLPRAASWASASV